jgi:hypothetical protein
MGEHHPQHLRGSPRTLRFGIMCRGARFSAWQAHCIRELLAVKGVEPALLIVDPEGDPGPAHRSAVARLTSPTAAWNLYQRLCVKGKLESEHPVELEKEFAGVPRLQCPAERRGKYAQYFSASDVAAIRAYDLDFILRFAYNIIRGDILSAARYGVWSYHHDDLDKIRGQPACLWEILLYDPVTGVTLQRLTEGLDSGVVLKKSYFQTVRKSYPRSRDAAFLDSTDLPARVCRDLLAGRGDYVSSAPSRTTAPIYRTPTNLQTLGLWARLTGNAIADAFGWLFRHRQWGVGIVDGPIHAFLAPEYKPKVRWLPPSSRRYFLADPFGVRRGSTTTIIAEEFDHAEQLGRLVAVEWPDGKDPAIRRGILDLRVHASYPYLIEHEGDIYCVPEISASGEVALFRAREFPSRWEKVATLVRGVEALDPSLVRHQGHWWMFYGVGGRRGAVHLCAMHAPALAGPWEPHAANPLKTDVRSTRPGGTIFVHQGTLYRPAQDGTRGYGWAISINRVTRLSPSEFEEEVASVVRADRDGPYPAGLHTLSSVGDLTLIDGQRARFVPVLFFAQLRKIARRLTGGARDVGAGAAPVGRTDRGSGRGS